MNTRYYMVIIKGEIKTSEIMSCGYNRNNQKWDVKFNNGKTYSYAYLNVEKLTDPEVLNPNMYRISREGREFFDVNAIYVFRSRYESYWHICFGNGSERDYHRSELNIVESCLTQSQSSNVFEYIKQIAGLSNIRNEETGEKLLSKRFDKISFVGSDVALARYLNPSSLQGKRTGREYNPIFPFGCNNSQYKAVKSAMENQISVIQGPPGTGKTQTILNIIANILMQGKTVQIVSNNNSATENVYEKLSSPKYNLGFIAATLGSSKNKKLFVEHQDAAYPDFSSWKTQEDPSVLQKGIAEQSSQLKSVFDKQEKLACLRQELSQLVTEQEYFNQYVKESDVHTDSINFKKKLSSKQWMVLWQECQLISDEKTAIGFWFKIKALFKYGVTDWSIYKQDISKIITTFQAMYYCAKQAELSAKIADIEKYLNSVNKNLLEDLCKQSMIVLKDKLARKYEGNSSRKTFSEDNLWKEPYDVLVEYPVILSTTFSSRNSLNSDVVYDYLIMDEASQVDIATGALALSCARNVVIVGDTKQLPNVVTDDIKAKAKAIFDSFNVSEGYQYTNSFLQSILDVIWDLYNENRELLGKDHVRGEQLPIDGYHLVVHVWIRNSKGEYLISQRSANRPTYPLMWECVGGSVVKGEDSLQGAIREAKEEVGVDLMPENGQVLFTKTRKIIEGKIFNDIMDVWLFDYDGEVDLGNATTDEVAQVAWMNREQIKELFDANMFVDTLEYFFTEDDRQ